MKLRNRSTNGESEAKSVLQPDVAEEKRHVPSAEEIRKRAFEIHIEHGGIHGFDMDDWLQAERELKEKRSDIEVKAPKSR